MTTTQQPGRYVWMPDDCVVVPKVPTEAMLNGARDWSIKKNGKGVGDDQAIGCYCAMLGAAPSLPEAPGVDWQTKVREFATTILHGDNPHRAWLLEAAELFVAGNAVPTPNIAPQPKLPSEEEIARVIYDEDAGEMFNRISQTAALRFARAVLALIAPSPASVDRK